MSSHVELEGVVEEWRRDTARVRVEIGDVEVIVLAKRTNALGSKTPLASGDRVRLEVHQGPSGLIGRITAKVDAEPSGKPGRVLASSPEGRERAARRGWR